MNPNDYLSYSLDWDDPTTVSLLDDVPLWSAPFGLMLLEQVKLKPALTVLDIGFGAGFPLIELAQRLGGTSTVYGIDGWAAAIQRARLKIQTFDIPNVTVIKGDAASMAFRDNMFDLIVSNTGVNNFADVDAVFRECWRVAKPGAQILLTTNPVGHMRELYDALAQTLVQLKLEHLMDRLDAQRRHRLSCETIRQHLKATGFTITGTRRETFSMRFLDGTAFLNHYFIKCAFLDGWKSIFPTENLNRVFSELEKNLNAIARQKKEFRVTIPTACIEAARPARDK